MSIARILLGVLLVVIGAHLLIPGLRFEYSNLIIGLLAAATGIVLLFRRTTPF